MKSLPRHKITTSRQLHDLQRWMARSIMRPLTPDNDMQSQWEDGRSMSKVAGEFIKPNDRLTSFERLEIYNRQYWYRVLDCFSQDFPGLRAVLGDKKFEVLAEQYLIRHPSSSFTLRNLGSRIEAFLRKEPQWTTPYEDLALDVARFEWAQTLAFDEMAYPVLKPADILHQNPTRLRLHLQPYVCLLELNHPVDDFLISLKQQNDSRSESSNATQKHRKTSGKKPVKRPKPQKVFVAVHRIEESLYYKRLEPEAYRILIALQKGMSLEKACTHALGKMEAPLDWSGRVQKWFRNWMALGWFFNSKQKPRTQRSIRR